MTSREEVVLNRWRAYDPRVGQYLQPEPVLVGGRMHPWDFAASVPRAVVPHPYAYAYSGPQNFMDSNGLWGIGFEYRFGSTFGDISHYAGINFEYTTSEGLGVYLITPGGNLDGVDGYVTPNGVGFAMPAASACVNYSWDDSGGWSGEFDTATLGGIPTPNVAGGYFSSPEGTQGVFLGVQVPGGLGLTYTRERFTPLLRSGPL